MTNPISVSDLGVALATRGWKATICDSREFGKLFPKEELVDVDPAGYLKCVDGRGSDAVGKQQHGPKMLGGVYGIALNRGIKTTKELEGICQEVAKAGHVPTVHGDEGGILGCGFCKLWLNGKFADEGGVNAAAPEFTADEGAAAVKSAGGVVENHVAKHTEKYVILNFCPDKTFVPNGNDQRFIVDCWALGKAKIGTTGRGIGPAYEDKTARRAIRVGDLADTDVLADKVDALLFHHNALLRGLNMPEVDAGALLAELNQMAPLLLPYATTVWQDLDEMRRKGNRILFEGAQGTMLDIDHGTYPFVTSSNTVAGQAAIGSGQGPGAIDYVLGITKAYTTRVGSGPFPTELTDEVGEQLGAKGREFGVVTGRKRRCGWFDAVLVRQAVKVNGITGIALTKLDVLDGQKELKVCVGYEIDGEKIDHLPASTVRQERVTPIYETLEGWDESTQGARSWAELPATAIKYIRRIEELIEAPVALLSTSPERDDTILVHDPFED